MAAPSLGRLGGVLFPTKWPMSVFTQPGQHALMVSPGFSFARIRVKALTHAFEKEYDLLAAPNPDSVSVPSATDRYKLRQLATVINGEGGFTSNSWASCSRSGSVKFRLRNLSLIRSWYGRSEDATEDMLTMRPLGDKIGMKA